MVPVRVTGQAFWAPAGVQGEKQEEHGEALARGDGWTRLRDAEMY